MGDRSAPSSANSSMRRKPRESNAAVVAVVPDPTPADQREARIQQLFNVFADTDSARVRRDEFLQARTLHALCGADGTQAVGETGLALATDPRLASLRQMDAAPSAVLDKSTFAGFALASRVLQ